MKKIIICYCLAILGSCQISSYEEEILPGYYLKAIDEKNGMSIYYLDGEYLIGVVEATVFAIGCNDKFIIAKQHPEDFPNINRSITSYYIIPVKDKISKSAEKNVIGPLTRDEFENKRIELGIPQSLTFTKVFEDLK